MMKYLTLCIAFLIISACGNPTSDYKDATNALDAGRGFIDACLKGDFIKAGFYMVQDEQNKKYLAQIETQYREKGREGRQQYREASINIAEVDEVTESMTIINYSNSYDKIGHKVKVMLQNGRWLVDFKYTFNPNL
ncbi:hypothetical protein [Parasediminibacterium sp. JCM 36343]|uniref:hypothetical protein n=1 Tax=Parasediminibacterium sp. JCM 36343 TaxID=3374279 RepID=UPI00397E6887